LLSDRRINKRNEKALIYAVEAGHIDVVNVLLQNNAPSQDELDILFVLAAKKR
jgi:ankyrin repeat protein